MKDYFIIEGINLDGIYGIHGHQTVMLRNGAGAHVTTGVNCVWIARDFVMCEQDIPNFYL
jgi:hypothetical protein